MHRFKLKQPGTPEAVFNIDGMLKYRSVIILTIVLIKQNVLQRFVVRPGISEGQLFRIPQYASVDVQNMVYSMCFIEIYHNLL